MLRAEEEGLVILHVSMPDINMDAFEEAMFNAWKSNGTGENETMWNDIRQEITQEAFRNHLVPAGAAWLKEELRERASVLIGERCQAELFNVSSSRPLNL